MPHSRDNGATSAVRVVVIAPPFGGKSTLCKLLEGLGGYPHVSSGATLRDLVQLQQDLDDAQISPDMLAEVEREMIGVLNKHEINLGLLLSQGRLVPHEPMVKIVALRLGQDDCKHGYILDGYPRTFEQADYLHFQTPWLAPHVALTLRVPDGELRARRAKRMSEDPRSDDEAFLIRLADFQRQAEVIEEFYGRLGILREVDGVGSPEEVFDRTVDVLQGVFPDRDEFRRSPALRK